MTHSVTSVTSVTFCHFRHLPPPPVTYRPLPPPSLSDPSSAVSGSENGPNLRALRARRPLPHSCHRAATTDPVVARFLHVFCSFRADTVASPAGGCSAGGGGEGRSDLGEGGRQLVTGVGVVTRRWSHRNWWHPVRLSPPTTTRSAFSLHAGSRT